MGLNYFFNVYVGDYVKNKMTTWLQIITLIGLLAFQFNNCASKTEGGVFDGPSTADLGTSGGPTDLFISPPLNLSTQVGDYRVGGNDILSFNGKCFQGDYPSHSIEATWKFRTVNSPLKTSLQSSCANSKDLACYTAKAKCEHGQYYFVLPLSDVTSYLSSLYTSSGTSKIDIEVKLQMVLVDSAGKEFRDSKFLTTGVGSVVFIPMP